MLIKNLDLLDRCWMDLAYALVGETLDAGDDICGAGKTKVYSFLKVTFLPLVCTDVDTFFCLVSGSTQAKGRSTGCVG